MAQGQIKMTPTQMNTYANKYSSSARNIEQLLSSLKSLQNTIRSEWSGQGFQQFDAEFGRLSQQTGKFAQLLDDISNRLKKSAQVMSETDRQIGSQFNS